MSDDAWNRLPAREQFLQRAKILGAIAHGKQRRSLDDEVLQRRRKEHLDHIARIDAAAAKLERAYLEATRLAEEAEMKLAEYYASRIEK